MKHFAIGHLATPLNMMKQLTRKIICSDTWVVKEEATFNIERCECIDCLVGLKEIRSKELALIDTQAEIVGLKNDAANRMKIVNEQIKEETVSVAMDDLPDKTKAVLPTEPPPIPEKAINEECLHLKGRDGR